MSEGPFTIHGDEPVEARIVSWVLGEASAFEAAELERLCEERPELLVFKRRMRALHGLLTEAEAAQPDEGWKLPPEKRKILDEIFGEEKVVCLEVEKEKRVRHSGRRAFLAIAACVVITLVVLRMVIPVEYQSETILEVKPRGTGMSPLGKSVLDSRGGEMTPQFFGTESEKIKSRATLEKVVENLELENRWKVDKETALEILKDSIKTERVPETNLIAIGVRHGNKVDARDICEEVANAYKEYRAEIEGRDAERQLQALNKAVRDQEDKVEERRKVLSTIARTKGIVYRGNDSFFNTSGVDEDQGAKNALDTFHQLEQDKMQLENQIGSLLKYDSDQLMTYASGLDLPDNSIRQTYPQYLEAKRQLESLKVSGLSDDHPTVKAEKESLDAMKRQLDEGVVNLRATLGAQLDLADQRLKKVEVMKDESREEAIRRGLDAQDYVDAKREFEADQELLQTMKVKQMGETIAGRIPGESVQIHDDPVVRPVSPSRTALSKLSHLWKDSPFTSKQPPAAPSASTGGISSRSAGKALAGERASEDMPALANRERQAQVDGTTAAASMSELGDVQDYDVGSGGAGAAGSFGRDAQVAAKDAEAKPAVTTAPRQTAATADPFADSSGPVAGQKARVLGGADMESRVSIGREMTYPAEFEAPELPNVELAGRMDGTAFPTTPATPQTWASQDEEVKDITLGLRSGDSPVSGVAVDAILNEDSGISGEMKEADLGADGSSYGLVLSNPALTDEHAKNVDEVRRSLYLAEGNLNLGKYDEAKKKYEETLRIDPYNTTARRGIEKVESAKSDYYRAAYDNTRAELLMQVDDSWELSVPADRPDETNGRLNENADVDPFWDTSNVAEADKPSGGTKGEIHTGYSNEYLFRGVDLNSADKEAKPAAELARREMTRRQSTVDESDKLLAAARSAYSRGDYQDAYGKYEKALNLLPDAPLMEERRDFLRKSLGDASVALSMKMERVGRFQESKQWLYKAREWDPGNARARQELIADVTSEIPAAEDPYSTFSLNISDASFQVAQTALAKGEQPDPAGIKVEQFYNAVDYGDPAPSANEPVAVNIEQSAHPVIPGRNLVRIALKTAAAGRSAAQPLRLTLLVDQSGSMVRDDRRAAMDKALAGLSELLTENDLVTVIGFSRTPHLLADAMTGDKAGKLAELVNQAASEGGTNLEEAIKLGEQMAGRQKLAGAQNRIVLFTDGAANLGNADPDRLAEKVKQLRQNGIAFDIAGIAADGLNDELLGELARNGNGRYYVVGKGADGNFAKQLAGAFRPAAENVKVQVRFNPERVGRYKLIGFEKDRLKTEDFRNDKVDAAELAAEEAGVAIYQVEPLPDGHGELGEVSVRFRDTASDQMVERTWTIPHDSGAPAIDRASPSMQLAVLSMLAGEKLKGGPLADAIDFKQLTAPAANVKQFYGTSGRAGEMLRVLDALK